MAQGVYTRLTQAEMEKLKAVQSLDVGISKSRAMRIAIQLAAYVIRKDPAAVQSVLKETRE